MKYSACITLLYFFFFSGTVDDIELIDGLLFKQRSAGLGGVTKIEKAKIGLIQFCVSPPKTNVIFFSSQKFSFFLLLKCLISLFIIAIKKLKFLNIFF